MDSTLAPTLTNDFRCHYEKYGLMNALCNLNLQFADVTLTIADVTFADVTLLCLNQKNI